MTTAVHRRVRLLLAALVSSLACASGNAAVQVVGVQYQQDNPYPEFNCQFHFGNYPTHCGVSVTGCNAMVFLKNTGVSPVTISDVSLAGHSLNNIIERNASLHDSASIYYHWDNPETEAPDIMAAGEPVWYRADPNPIPAGGFSRVVVRLRFVPVTKPISLVVNTSAGNVATNVVVDGSVPVLASVGFSTNRMKVYLHWRRNGGAAPASVWLDGTNVTSLTSTVGDPTMNFAVSVIQLSAPLANMSYHLFQGVYGDGKTASGSLRVWINRYLYGTWGVREIPDNDDAAAQAWINECQIRGVNCYVNNSSGGLQDYMGTAGGQAYAEARDYGYVKDASWGTNPRMWFIDDEPDLEEGFLGCGTGFKVPCNGLHTSGILGMVMLERGENLRAMNPSAPTTINLDGNFKPDGWFTYGQLADVMMMDSYYEGEQAGVHWDRPNAIPVFRKATSIYAAAIATTTAAEPNPMHMILNSVEWKRDNEHIWPFSSPAGKRIQAYYALAGGAKGMAYWWFKSGYPYNGLAANTPAANALWKEIGMIGNEIKAAQPLLVISHPVTLPLNPSLNVWARTLAADINSLLLIAVNDNYLNDETGTHLTNVPNAWVTNTLPTWLQGGELTAFEISAGGLKPISTQLNGNQLAVSLGTLVVSRMVVLTQDPQLLSTLQRRYDSLVRPGICALDSASCTNVPLSIAQGPANLVLAPGGSGSFNVAAFGTGLKYRWQKNLNNLNDGGHYSGCTNATLTVTGADANDEASYRCVVSTTYGTNTSSAATLSLTTDPPAIPVANPATAVNSNSFTANWSSANGATSYRLDISTNSGFGSFVSGYQDLNVGSVLSWNVTGLSVGTTYYYRVRGYNPNGASGNSGTISVTLTAPVACPPTGLLNASFEGGNTGGVATGWTGYQRAPNPSTIWSIQIASPPSGAGTNYQQIANSSSTGGGGVRQNITGCVIGATYTISGWMRGNSGLYSTCTVKVSPTASTSWATATNLTPAATYTGSSWTPFSGAVVATGTNMTLWLDGQTGGTSEFNAECFDAITIGCELTSIPPSITQQPSNQSVAAGGSANFTMQAYGSEPLSYRWQKNSTNLNDGGHYSGVLTPTLAITGADNNDAASYRCVVTNAYGTTNTLAATLTVTNAAILPPSITQQPANQSVAAGGTASFTVGAAGSGTLYYRWQKNSTNLNDGGHYSGVWTPLLTITGADNNDVANYRCVVTNAFGSTNSMGASLTVTQAATACFAIMNADFESGFGLAGGGYIATNWIEWEAVPGVTTGYIESSLVHGGAYAQRLRISGTNTSGGVYQRVPVTSGALCAVSVWIYADTALTSCYLGVDPAGGTNASGAVIWSTATTNVAWVQRSWVGTATANYLTVFYKVATPDSVKRNGYFDDALPGGLSTPPQLVAQRNGSNLTLRWAECPAAHLEQAGSLTSSWSTATNQVSVGGGQKSVTITPTGSAGYYRLVVE